MRGGGGGGCNPLPASKGVWGSAVSSPIGSGAPPQKLYKLCIINVLNHKEFHCSSPPKNHGMNSKFTFEMLQTLAYILYIFIK